MQWSKIDDIRFTPFVYDLFLRIHHNFVVVIIQLKRRKNGKASDFNAKERVNIIFFLLIFTSINFFHIYFWNLFFIGKINY